MGETLNRELADRLTALARQQREAREAVARGAFDAAVKTSLIFIEVYYTNLPENIARRLTHIDGDAARELVSRLNTLEGEMLRAYVEKVASAEALAQGIRAANAYRARLGLPLLDENGKLPGEEAVSWE